VADQGTDNSKVTIHAKFNGGDTTDQNVVAGCQLDAVWPRNYGDIYFGEDNCLYDGSGKSISNQCCTSSTTSSVANPYYQSKPASTPNSKGTNIVSSKISLFTESQ